MNLRPLDPQHKRGGRCAAVVATLCEDAGLVPGTPLPEGFRLVTALHGTGYTVAARTLYDRLLTVRNEVGLLSSLYLPGNRPSGLAPDTTSTVGVLNAARSLRPRTNHA